MTPVAAALAGAVAFGVVYALVHFVLLPYVFPRIPAAERVYVARIVACWPQDLVLSALALYWRVAETLTRGPAAVGLHRVAAGGVDMGVLAGAFMGFLFVDAIVVFAMYGRRFDRMLIFHHVCGLTAIYLIQQEAWSALDILLLTLASQLPFTAGFLLQKAERWPAAHVPLARWSLYGSIGVRQTLVPLLGVLDLGYTTYMREHASWGVIAQYIGAELTFAALAWPSTKRLRARLDALLKSSAQAGAK